jgi:AbiTii
MNLISELKNDVIDSKVSISTALRKAKVLASLLKNEKMKEWIDRELNGYFNVEVEEIPSYRRANGQNFGTFTGQFGRRIDDAHIPLLTLPPIIQDYAKFIYFRDGVKALESIVEKSDQVMQMKWPADFIVYVQKNCEIYQDMILADAWQLFNISEVESVLDTVRNRLLDFILSLEEDFPEYMKDENKIKRIPEEKVTTSFNMHIYGGQNIIAGGTKINQSIGTINSQNNFSELKEFLKSLNIPNEEIDKLEKAIKDDGEVTGKNFGTKVSDWIGNISKKFLKGTIDVAKQSATSIILEVTKSLARYYGIYLP